MTFFRRVRTPCVGICSTGIGDDVCRGCKRFSQEVIDWNSYSHSQRLTIAERLEGFLAQVVDNYFVIFDRHKLKSQMTHQQLRFQPQQNPQCWVFDLLIAGASQIDTLEPYGLRLHYRHQGRDLIDIKQAIDADYYALSVAHFERYFTSPHLLAPQLPSK